VRCGGLCRATYQARGRPIGQAFVGNIGERELYDFTAVGDPVNTTARAQ